MKEAIPDTGKGEMMKDVKELVRGLQHIGIPTKEFDATIAFYGSLGFAVIHENRSEGGRVAFLRLNDLVIETYEEPQTAMNAEPSTTSPWMSLTSRQRMRPLRGLAILPWREACRRCPSSRGG